MIAFSVEKGVLPSPHKWSSWPSGGELILNSLCLYVAVNPITEASFVYSRYEDASNFNEFGFSLYTLYTAWSDPGNSIGYLVNDFWTTVLRLEFKKVNNLIIKSSSTALVFLLVHQDFLSEKLAVLVQNKIADKTYSTPYVKEHPIYQHAIIHKEASFTIRGVQHTLEFSFKTIIQPLYPTWG
jgi:hypothetical protein